MSLRKKVKVCEGYVFKRIYTNLDPRLKYYKVPCRICNLYYRNYCGFGNNKMALVCIKVNAHQNSEPISYMYKGVIEES